MNTLLALSLSLLRITVEVCFGIVLGQLLEVLGWTRRLGMVARPFLAIGRLPSQIHATFTTAFVSAAAANASLIAHRDAGNLTDREVFFGALLHGFPSQFSHMPSQFVPLLLLVGWPVTLAFFGVQIASGFVRTLVLLLWARIRPAAQTLPTAEVENVASAGTEAPEAEAHEIPPSSVPEESEVKRGTRSVFRLALCRSARPLRRVLLVTIPICAIFLVMRKAGMLDVLGPWMGQVPGLRGLAPEAPAVVAAHFASLLTAGAAAADLLREGLVTDPAAAMILLIGSFLATPIRTLRHSGGVYLGIFGPRLGLRILLVSQGLRMAFLLMGIIGVGLIWR